MIKKVVAALAVGMLIAACYLQQDPWIRSTVQRHVIAALQESGKCQMCGTLTDMNLYTLHPYLEFSDVTVTPIKGAAWNWTAKKFRITTSWLHLLSFRSLALWVQLDDIGSTTAYTDYGIAIFEHLNALSSNSNAPIAMFVQEVRCNNMRANIHYMDRGGCTMLGNLHAQKIGHLFQIALQVTDGHLEVNQHPYVRDMRGSFVLDSFTNSDGASDYRGHGKGSGASLQPAAQPQRYIFDVSYDQGHGAFNIKAADESLYLPITVTVGNDGYYGRADLQTSIAHLSTFMQQPLGAYLFDGTVQGLCLFHGNVGGVDGQATINVDNVTCNQQKLSTHTTLTMHKEAEQWHGTCESSYDDWYAVQGTWSWHATTMRGSLNLTNPTKIAVAGLPWYINPQALSVHAQVNQVHQKTELNYTATACHDLYEHPIISRGELVHNGQEIELQGSLAGINYAVTADATHYPYLRSCTIKDHQNTVLCTGSADMHNNQKFSGYAQVAALRRLASWLWGYDLQGDGRFDIHVDTAHAITGSIVLAQGNIRLPHTYNFIDQLELKAAYHPEQRTIDLDRIKGRLHRGAFSSPGGHLSFDDAYRVSYAYLPLLFDHCLLNIKQDLFAIVSGNLLLNKQHDQLPRISSKLIVEHAQLKENIFSPQVQQQLFKMGSATFDVPGSDLLCDIVLETRAPIEIKTDFLQASAKVNLTAKKSIHAPEISGSIDLTAGSLLFPYKPLLITHGKLHFMPQQSHDPLIELTARNTIKKHTVTMSLAGSLGAPHIMLGSSPTLTEEQIIALLLVGSEQESLNVMVPALLMQNISSLVFGYDQSATHLDKYFKSLIKPFKQVHLVPSFTDQTGRGGLRGALEVDINDRWRALIQKNFNLSEDTKFELEYMLSDDVSVRGFRDERRDVGTEVEMRWKF